VVPDLERIAHLQSLRALPPAEWSTRDRILYEASRLMAAKGYHGASTRDITNAVGIRQPSMFNHFASKQHILAELLRFTLSIPAERAHTLAASSGRPVTRLYRYMAWDFEWYSEMPFDLRGIQEDHLNEPGLEEFYGDLQVWRKSINSIVRAGVVAGEFHSDTASMVTTVLTSISFEIIRSTQQGIEPRKAVKLRNGAATFVLRGLLCDPSELDDIIAATSPSTG
jgi:AcrR family transcriptional regulator